MKLSRVRFRYSEKGPKGSKALGAIQRPLKASSEFCCTETLKAFSAAEVRSFHQGYKGWPQAEPSRIGRASSLRHIPCLWPALPSCEKSGHRLTRTIQGKGRPNKGLIVTLSLATRDSLYPNGPNQSVHDPCQVHTECSCTW